MTIGSVVVAVYRLFILTDYLKGLGGMIPASLNSMLMHSWMIVSHDEFKRVYIPLRWLVAPFPGGLCLDVFLTCFSFRETRATRSSCLLSI